MRKNLIFILAVAIISIAIMAAGRILFMACFPELASECTSAELFTSFLQGFRLDITTTGYIVAPLIVVLWIGMFVNVSLAPLMRIYLDVAALTVSVFYTANIVMYGYWGFPIDASILQYMESPFAVLQSVTWVEVVECAGILVLHFAIMALLYMQCMALYTDRFNPKPRWAWSVIMLVVAGGDFLAIRGGVSPAVANVSKVFFSSNQFLNHAAVNPTFSFLSSLGTEDGNGYRFFSDEECMRNFAAIRDRSSSTSVSVLRPEAARPDIVMIIAESFGTSTIETSENGREVAPGFMRLRNEGIYFSAAVASSFRTDRGVVATLSGFPAQTMTSIMKEPSKSRRLPSLASALSANGYTSIYVHGGDLNFTDMSSYLYGTGFDTLEDIRSIDIDAPKGKWGYRDDAMSAYFADRIASTPSPFLAVWQTLSSHEPFDCPDMGFEDRMLNSMAFADKAIASLVDTLKATDKWKNMVLVIVADHAFAYPYGIAASALERHRIPILITGGAITDSVTVSSPVSQTDLAATIAGIIGIDSSDFAFSRNALGDDPTFGYWVFNNGFGVIDRNGYTIFDCTSGNVIGGEESATRLMLGKTMLQTTYQKIREL